MLWSSWSRLCPDMPRAVAKPARCSLDDISLIGLKANPKKRLHHLPVQSYAHEMVVHPHLLALRVRLEHHRTLDGLC